MTSTAGPQAPTAESEAKYAENLLATFQYWSVYLHPNQYFLGRVYIWCNRPEAIDLMQDLTPEEWYELRHVGIVAQEAIKKAFNPHLFNQSSLGNETKRCHVHIVPRYGDTKGFAGIEFPDEVYGRNWGTYDKDSDPIKKRPDVHVLIKQVLQRAFEEVRGG
jgi:diadenosine tetraphosphate (Ap4A) HIT family hydrolase